MWLYFDSFEPLRWWRGAASAALRFPFETVFAEIAKTSIKCYMEQYLMENVILLRLLIYRNKRGAEISE